MPLPIDPCWKFHNTNFHLVKAAPKAFAAKRNPSLNLLHVLLRSYELQNQNHTQFNQTLLLKTAYIYVTKLFQILINSCLITFSITLRFYSIVIRIIEVCNNTLVTCTLVRYIIQLGREKANTSQSLLMACLWLFLAAKYW